MKLLVLLVLLALLPAPVLAQQRVASVDGLPAYDAAVVAFAARVSPPPVIDGRDDDPVWRAVPVIDQFLEYEPQEGAATRFRTEVRVAYDDRYLYVLARMFDPAPDSIVSLLSRRDVRTQSEQLKLVIDSYHDGRTAYQFITNPAGVKRDFYVYNDVTEDASWDAVWDVGTTIDSLGWVAEFRIPFSQLRFANRDAHTFGLLIVRDVARTNQRISWPLYRRGQQGYVSQAGELRGLSELPSPRRIELVPYVLTKNESVQQANGFSHPQRFTAGADLKVGLSSNLTLDATVNPDFGQVEADPAVLNLGAFETFFQERRPFFLEGTGIFSFNVSCADIDTGCRGLFYSRRVGRSPQLRSGTDYDAPLASTILGAAKVTGRLANGMSVGLLNAYTQQERAGDGREIEPGTNYLVARVQQDLGNGQGGVGAMLTATNRSLDDASAPFLRREAYTGGVDFRHRFSERRYEFAASFSGSYVSGSEEAIARTQLDGVHRYQRPDGRLNFDPTRTSLTGDAQRMSLSKFGGGITRFQSVLQRFSPGFEINDLGFLQRADEQMFRNWFSLQFNQPTSIYNRAFFNFNHWSHWTSGGLPTQLGFNNNSHVEFRNSWWGHMWTSVGGFGGTFDDRVARGGPAVRRSPWFEIGGGVEGDRRWRIVPNLFGGMWRSSDAHSDSWWIEPSIQFRASTRLNGSFGVSYSSNTSDAQWLGNIPGDEGVAYTFARLEQSTFSMTTRVNYTISPTLSLQFYAQPFVSTGDYSDWKQLDDPRATRYENRYRPYDGGDPGGFNFKQVRTNAVLRWEYRPGSALFAVWQHGREDFDPTASSFSFRRDYGDLLSLHPRNTFLIKASWWLNP
jgi:hypothetical protein